MAIQLIIRGDSPFHFIGTLTGKRNSGRHVTLQNLYKVLKLLFKPEQLLSLTYFNAVKEQYNTEWLDYKAFRITHIVCLNALAILGAEIILRIPSSEFKHKNYQRIFKDVKRLRFIDWSSEGAFKFIKGMSGSRALAADLISSL
ncbi:hypothetical protein EJP82_12620 [Paenibacillus anaericanus]|uniref:Uncharacterized protein n=1 Tax=Paenibacillus anaericanus TaxID=170367 RepID=A0A433Y8S0_9BACL|nr:hypothetical protein [Paenibacillus anaericanus]RUT46313.1 hypothetical protein EJP82_12620 [Paenibacillus anaericanus]